VSYSGVGLLASQQNDLATALDAFEEAENLALQVKEADPAAANAVHDLAWVEARLGEVRHKIAEAGNSK
jgi:hypothetical protein